jgi:hypothetical protein
MSVFRIAVLALFSLLLSGCGGGGGGGGGQQPNGTTDFRVTLDRSAITFQATAGSAPPSQTIVATWTGTPPDPVYINAIVEGAGIAPTIPILITSSSATATVSVAGGLSAGNYAGRINFLVCRDTACNQRVGGSPLPVSFTVNVASGGSGSGGSGDAPTISIPAGPVVIGGTDGLGTGGANIAVSIDTATNGYSWTASAATANGVQWLTTAPAGQTDSTATNIAIDADRSLVAPGSHQGTVLVQFNVRGRTYSRSVPVVLNKEGHWLQASAHGAAFSSFPARSVLSRSVQITSTRGRTDVPWSATSDASWLTVTPSGTTGGTLVLTADPTGLPQDTTHIANVTIASSDPAIQNQESIRVALWASATDPQDLKISADVLHVVANPVEPWVYTNFGNINGNSIRVYNVYTGALVDTWAPALTTPADMEISQDGRLLFVNDTGSHRIVALDARTGSTVQSYAYAENSSSTGIAYMHVGGKPTLITGIGNLYDVASGVRKTGTINAGWYGGMLSFAVDPLHRYLFTQDMGISASTASQFSIKRTALNDDAVVVTFIRTASGGSNGQDLCVSSDGERVYTANGAPYGFYIFGASSFQSSGALAGEAYPNNTVCGWNGVFVGGSNSYYSMQDVWIYRADGSLVTALKMGDTTYTSMEPRSLALSGDNTRVMGYVGGVSVAWLVFKGIPAP